MPIIIRPLSKFISDPMLAVILAAAILFWLVLSYYIPVTNNFLWPLSNPMLFIVPVILYPILEEIIFRGAILEFLQQKIPGIVFFHLTKANIVCSLLFTIMHFFYHPPLWASLVIVPSLVFGLLKERYQSLVPPILIHVFFNAGYYYLFMNAG